MTVNPSSGPATSNGTATATVVADAGVRVRPPVVDACSLVYDDAGWRVYLNRLGENAPEYLDVFSASFCRYFGASHTAYRDALALRRQDAVDVLLPPGRPPFDLAA
ncbi:amidohydrolase, partial [Streptomyces sp. SID8455]|nr:amidohydrolase [Streptomyces sp. SID8455]